jgi:hypothetical protein
MEDKLTNQSYAKLQEANKLALSHTLAEVKEQVSYWTGEAKKDKKGSDHYPKARLILYSGLLTSLLAKN